MDGFGLCLVSDTGTQGFLPTPSPSEEGNQVFVQQSIILSLQGVMTVYV
ncbi:hypothetical protein CLV24_108150 [Pontibacter ummariensis]|uniref:Uncharacterized protein n=1 Tax=Pontibacter ummariensis TaxID=1610492 RepID=A0A239F7F2_9BACT|nr:hypothetical protein [Pontibacter ummariensis]PRY12406.1 hypothetical protein CLV24_108150 [Pontibacter ummariensis]SNS52408.1 hypothetical protein SAMN06296052_10835 [Pontibacter ummariensis]